MIWGGVLALMAVVVPVCVWAANARTPEERKDELEDESLT